MAENIKHDELNNEELKSKLLMTRKELEIQSSGVLRVETEENPLMASSSQERKCNYPAEYFKTIICIISFVLSVTLNHLAVSTAHDVASRNALPDLSFAYLPQQDWALDVGDYLCCASATITILFITFFHPHRFVILRRLFYISTILYTMRAICMCVTHIPTGYSNNYAKCSDPDENATYFTIFKRFWNVIIRLGLQFKDKDGRILCGDLLFSGHTLIVSITTFFMNHYTPHSVWPLRWILIITCVAGMICLSLSRTHYTVDVLIAYWLSSTMFSIYHAFVFIPHEKRPRARAFRRLIIFWTMFELEVNVPSGRLPNELEWPFPWPKCLKDFFYNWSHRRTDSRVGNTAEILDAHRLKTHL